MGLEGGASSLYCKIWNLGWIGHGSFFWGWWNFSEQIQISFQNIFEGYFAHREQPPPLIGSYAQRCGRHRCRRSVQALAHMCYPVLSMGSYSQFCWILHPYRVAVPFPPTFASPWRNSFTFMRNIFVEGQIWDLLSKMNQKRHQLLVGVIVWYG